jgi:hypothetical protein
MPLTETEKLWSHTFYFIYLTSILVAFRSIESKISKQWNKSFPVYIITYYQWTIQESTDALMRIDHYKNFRFYKLEENHVIEPMGEWGVYDSNWANKVVFSMTQVARYTQLLS